MDVLADRFHNERVDFTRSQANTQLGSGSPQCSDKAFTNLLRKVGEASKCPFNRHVKMVSTDLRPENKKEAEAQYQNLQSVDSDKAAEDAGLAAKNGTSSVSVEAFDADVADLTNADAASTKTDTFIDDDKDQSHNSKVSGHVCSVSDTTARPNVDLPQSAGGPVVEGTISLEGSEEAEEISSGANTGHSADGDAGTGSTEFIAATIDAVEFATKKTDRLSRRKSRALRDASAAADTAFDAYDSAVVLSDHTGANSPCAADRTRRTNNRITVVRA